MLDREGGRGAAGMGRESIGKHCGRKEHMNMGRPGGKGKTEKDADWIERRW